MDDDKVTTNVITMPFNVLETLLSVIIQCPKECLYAVINESNKRIQIYSTSNMISSVSRLAQDINTLGHEQLLRDIKNSKVKVVVLETVFPDKKSRYNLYRVLTQQYKNDGWSFYSDKNIAKYSVRESYLHRFGGLYYVIELEAKNGIRTLIGAFKKAREAKSFLAEHYPDGIVTEIVVSSNEETRLWLG